jgi:phage gp36-like protein
MPNKQVQKYASERKDFGVIWTAKLKDVAPTEVIVSSVWELLDGDIVINNTLTVIGDLPPHGWSATETTIWTEAGTEGTFARLKNSVTTNSGRVFSEIIEIAVADVINLAVAGRYATLQDVFNIFGRNNVIKWAKIENFDEAAIDTRIANFIGQAEDEIDDALRGIYPVPFTGIVPSLIKRIAATLAGVRIYEAKGNLDYNPESGFAEHRLKYHNVWATNQLKMLRAHRIQLEVDSGNVTYPQVLDETEEKEYSPFLVFEFRE